MGSRPSSTIAYGVCFPEGTKFPWDNNWNNDFYEWLFKIDGFKAKTILPDIYDEEGNYKEGITKEQKLERDDALTKYFRERSEFRKKHPEKIVIVQTGSDGCFREAICLINSYHYINWDNEFFEIPEKMKKNLFEIAKDDMQYFNDFIQNHIIPYIEKNKTEYDEEIDYTPKWLWSCYYG